MSREIEYIDANDIFNIDEDLINKWIHKLEGDLSILKGELMRRELGVGTIEWETATDLFDKFGIPKWEKVKNNN